MQSKVEKMAYHQKPIPVDMHGREEINYVILRAIYRLYSLDCVDKKTAKNLKIRLEKINALVSTARQEYFRSIYSLLETEHSTHHSKSALIDMRYIDSYFNLVYGMTISPKNSNNILGRVD